MEQVRRIGILLVLLTLATLLASCATGATGLHPPSDSYVGVGRGQSLGEALNAAKMDAVRKAVIDLIGASAESTNRSTLDDVLYSTRTPNAFVFNDTLEILREDGSLIEKDLYREVRIRVNVEAVQQTLDANSIGRTAATNDASATAVGVDSDADGGSASVSTINPGDWDPVTPEEERFIRRYVETMTYMVYFADRSDVFAHDDEFVMKSAVNQASSYLVADGRVVIDAAQVERLKEDQRLVYEEESGREISLLQWVARRLNADIYIELDAQLSSRSSKDDHYGSADVTLNMYETSTGQIVGSVNRRSQNSYSRIGVQDALTNAVQSAVYQAMPAAIEMSRSQMSRLLTRGIRFELTIQNQPDARTMSRFRSAMADEVRETATVSQSLEEILYEVFYIGSTDEMIELVFEVSERVAGLEELDLVISRSRSLTFDAGY